MTSEYVATMLEIGTGVPQRWWVLREHLALLDLPEHDPQRQAANIAVKIEPDGQVMYRPATSVRRANP